MPGVTAGRFAGLGADFKHAARIYRKTPWQSGLAILMLAAAMALVSAMATLWSDLHLGGLPGIESNRGLVTVGLRGEFNLGVMGANSAAELRRTVNTLEQVSGTTTGAFLQSVPLNDEVLEGPVEAVLPGYFQTLRPRLALGRGLEDDDFANGGRRHMVISHDLWRRVFGEDPDVLLREVDFNGESWRVVGVAEPAFTGTGNGRPLLWLPYGRFMRDIQGFPEMIVDDIPMFRLFGRKTPGVGTAAVEAELAQFFDSHQFPSMFGVRSSEELLVVDGIVAFVQQHTAAQRQVTILLVTSGLVALVAAVNLGIFLLARAPARHRELALRQALGAGRRRIVRQLLTEAGLLVVLATAAGLLLSLWLAAAFRELPFLERAGLTGTGFDPAALLFTAMLAAVLTALVALVPATLVRRARLGEQSRQASSRPGLFQHGAALVQLSLAGMVGACALAFLVHLIVLEQRDPGFRADGVQAALLGMQDVSSGMQPSLPSTEAITAFRDDARERLTALPGVESISFAFPLPGQSSMASVSWEIEGRQASADLVNIAPGFFALMNGALLYGRDFEFDFEPGVIVNRHFAEQAWGEVDVVGRHVTGEDDQMRIIGVVENMVFGHPDDAVSGLVFSTSMGFHGSMLAVLVRGNAAPSDIENRVNEALDRHMDAMVVMDVRPLSEIRAETTARDRARAGITALYGSLIVVMAGFGFFALQRFLVDSAQREIAVHKALGAGPRSVRRGVLKTGLRLGLPGLLLGALLGLIAVAWLRDDLISASVNAPGIATLTLAGMLLLLLLATLQPARRAAALKAGDLLREE